MKLNRVAACIAVAAAASVGVTSGGEPPRRDGNWLLDLCGAGEQYPWKVTACRAYLSGITDLHVVVTLARPGREMKPIFCTPEGVTIEQVVLVVAKHLRDHPEELHYQAVALVVGALVDAFPCKDEKKGSENAK
jgi:hypothetical protein